MPTSDYLPVATSGSANVDTQADFAGSGYQLNGFQNGIALPDQANKIWRQSSVVGAALTNLIVQITGLSVPDDGNVSVLIQKLAAAACATEFFGTSAGTGNIQTLTPTVPLIGYQNGAEYRFIAGYTNTGATTLAISGLTAYPINKKTSGGPSALIGGEIVAGNEVTVTFAGASFQMDVPLTGTIQTLGNPGCFQIGPLILQWGLVDFGSIQQEGLFGPYAFAIPFPTACLNLQLTSMTQEHPGDTSSSDNVAMISVFYLPSSSTTQFSIWNNNIAGTNGLRGFSWFAIGY